MSLLYILDKVRSSLGFNSPDLNPAQRQIVLNYINEAAEEIWETQDLPGCLQEVYSNVSPELRISLPPFVGEIRAVRNRRWNGFMALADIRARYAGEDWPEKWNKFRKIGESALANEITNAAPISIVYPEADTDLQITIIGVTANSNRCTETITMTNPLMNGSKSFIEIIKITKNKATDFNIIIQDTEARELALIYADQLEARYLIADISKYPNISGCTDGNYIMEILFKPRLPLFKNDTDEFPLIGYDKVIVLRTKQLIAEEQEGKEERAVLMNEKAKEILKNKQMDKDGPVSAKITTKRNKMFGLFSPYHGYGGFNSYGPYDQ